MSQIQNLGFGSVGVNRGLYKKADSLERSLKTEMAAEMTEGEEMRQIIAAILNVKHSLLRFIKLVNGVQAAQHAGYSELDRTYQMQGSDRERQLLDKIAAFQPPTEGSVLDVIEGFEYLTVKINKAISAIMVSVADVGIGGVSFIVEYVMFSNFIYPTQIVLSLSDSRDRVAMAVNETLLGI